MKPVRIKSDGTIHGTKISVNGVQLKNVKSLRLEGDAEEDDIMKLHLTLYALPSVVDIELDGQVEVSEQHVPVGTGTEAP
jgi:hypothetical protein